MAAKRKRNQRRRKASAQNTGPGGFWLFFITRLLAGGIFYYPADSKDLKKRHGKLRLLYECAPLAFIAEQAGGFASDGYQPVLDIKPTSLHQRTPFFVGNRDLVKKAEAFVKRYG